MTTQTADISAVIRPLVDNFESAFGQGDAAGLASAYTDEAAVLPTGSDFVRGKDAIAAFWQAVLDMGPKSAKIEIVELDQHGDTVIDMGKYTMFGADDQVMDQGKYVVIWKNVGSSWKMHRDIFNSSMPQQ